MKFLALLGCDSVTSSYIPSLLFKELSSHRIGTSTSTLGRSLSAVQNFLKSVLIVDSLSVYSLMLIGCLEKKSAKKSKNYFRLIYFTYLRVLSTSASCFKVISFTLCFAVLARFLFTIEMLVWSSTLSSLQHSLSRKNPSHLLTLLYSEITSATPNIEFHLSVFEAELT